MLQATGFMCVCCNTLQVSGLCCRLQVLGCILHAITCCRLQVYVTGYRFYECTLQQVAGFRSALQAIVLILHAVIGCRLQVAWLHVIQVIGTCARPGYLPSYLLCACGAPLGIDNAPTAHCACGADRLLLLPYYRKFADGTCPVLVWESFSVSRGGLLAQSFSVCEAKIVNHAAERRLAPPSRPRGRR